MNIQWCNICSPRCQNGVDNSPSNSQKTVCLWRFLRVSIVWWLRSHNHVSICQVKTWILYLSVLESHENPAKTVLFLACRLSLLTWKQIVFMFGWSHTWRLTLVPYMVTGHWLITITAHRRSVTNCVSLTSYCPASPVAAHVSKVEVDGMVHIFVIEV